MLLLLLLAGAVLLLGAEQLGAGAGAEELLLGLLEQAAIDRTIAAAITAVSTFFILCKLLSFLPPMRGSIGAAAQSGHETKMFRLN